MAMFAPAAIGSRHELMGARLMKGTSRRAYAAAAAGRDCHGAMLLLEMARTGGDWVRWRYPGRAVRWLGRIWRRPVRRGCWCTALPLIMAVHVRADPGEVRPPSPLRGY
jgi:hypothetical protein